MDADYLRETVGEALSAALAATLIANPNDPVEYLANYLTKQITIKQHSNSQIDQFNQLITDDAKYESEQFALKQEYEQRLHNAAQLRDSHQRELTRYLETVDEPSQVFNGFFRSISPLIEVSSLSFYSFVLEGSEPDSQVLRFHSIQEPSSQSHDLFSCKLSRADGNGIVFTLFDETEETEESNDETNDESFVDRSLMVDARLSTLFLPNVRVGPKASQVHFFRSPQSGSFLAVRFRWQSVISEASFDDALEKIHEREERKREEEEARIKAAEEAADEDQVVEPEEEEEEEEIDEDDEEAVRLRDEKRAERELKRAELAKIKAETPEEKAARLACEAQLQLEQEHRELLASVTKQTINQAVCVDTLATGARLPDHSVQFIHDNLRLLMESTLRIDRTRFKPELAAYEEFVQWQTSNTNKEDDDGSNAEDEAKEQRSKIKDDLQESNLPCSVQDVELAYATAQFVRLASESQGLSKARACSLLRGGGIEVYQAALLLTGYERNVIGDWEWRTDWTRIREVVDQQFIDRIVAYKPRGDEDAAKEKQVKQFIAAVDMEKVTERNCLTLALYNWMKSVIDVRRRVRLERKKAKEQAERDRFERERLAEEAAEAERLERERLEEEAAAEALEREEEETNED